MTEAPPGPEADAQPASKAALAVPPTARSTRWRQIVPFVLAVALIAFVVGRLDLRAFASHLAAVNVPALFLSATVFVLALLSADAFATVIVYRRLLAKIGYGEFWILRGASYLPSLLNHHVGQAFITYFLARHHGVSLARAAGATLVSYASWGGCVLGLAVLALLSTGQSVLWSVAVVGAGLAYLALLAVQPASLARVKLLAPLFEAGVGGHLVALVARIPHVIVLFLGTWLPLHAFGVEIPLLDAIVRVPVLMVAVTLPLTPQGFGTRDLLAQKLFEPFAPGETTAQHLAAISACTLCWPIILMIVDGLLGFALLRLAMPQLTSRPGLKAGAGGSPAESPSGSRREKPAKSPVA